MTLSNHYLNKHLNMRIQNTDGDDAGGSDVEFIMHPDITCGRLL